jgi:succinylglutamate desuccinylase
VGDVGRVLGKVRGAQDGPTLLCVAGLHGNEPAGVHAVQAVLLELSALADEMAGDFVALAGNRAALAQGRRYIDRDLNRAWTPERLETLRNGGPKHEEDREQVELLDAIEAVVEDARGPVYVLDLHTTSGPGAPFSTFGDSLPNRDFAQHIPVPMVLGLEELVKGTLLGFLGAHGLVAVAFESGQHVEPEAVARAEAGIWISLATTRLLPEGRLPKLAEGWKALRKRTQDLPRALEMRYRHDITPGDGFRMKTGYENFQGVTEGEVLALDGTGDVRVTETSRVLMPLYQEQGEDGFFLVREFSPFWLRVSYMMRCARLERLAHWLPGVRRDPTEPDTLHVDKHVARWFAKQLFHLLGFREIEDVGAHLAMRRRRYDEARFIARGPTPEHLEEPMPEHVEEPTPEHVE